MTAAVADAKPSQTYDQKLEKASYRSIDLTPTVDILKEIGQRKGDRVLIGFAAQTGGDGVAKAIEKYSQKNLDLIYLNDVSGGAIFGSDQTSGTLLTNGEVYEEIATASKLTLADKLLDFAAHKLGLAHD